MRTADVGLYSVEVRNALGSTTSDPALLTIGPATVAPVIAAAPTHVTLFAGDTATFAVAANGTAPFAYQWFRDGVAISGATAAALRIGAALSADTGSCTVSVTNAAGTVTSTAATLTVTPASRISNLIAEREKRGPARRTIARNAALPLASVSELASFPEALLPL